MPNNPNCEIRAIKMDKELFVKAKQAAKDQDLNFSQLARRGLKLAIMQIENNDRFV